jgi:hypothetical protein
LFYVNCYKNWFFRLVMIRHCRLFLWLLNDCEIVAENEVCLLICYQCLNF